MSGLVNKGLVKGAGLMNMDNRINYFKVAPKALENMLEMEKYTKKTGIDKLLIELIKLRVSQINGCSYCINMHTKAARKRKATDEQIAQLQTWGETDIFSPQEKVALELAEHVTLISEKRVDDELYQRVREHYDEKEYVDLIVIINQINMWNRLAISMGNTVKD